MSLREDYLTAIISLSMSLCVYSINFDRVFIGYDSYNVVFVGVVRLVSLSRMLFICFIQ